MSKFAALVLAAAAALAGPVAAAPFADGFRYAITCTDVPCEFTQMIAPAGFQDLSIWIADSEVGTVDGGTPFLFAPGVSTFEIRDIAPAVDVANAFAFPVFLAWNGDLVVLQITPLLAQPVPAPGSLALVAAAGLALAIGRRRSSARRLT